MRRLISLVFVVGFLLLCHSRIVRADSSDEQVQFARDIVVEKEATAGDLVCLWCSIRLRGQSDGDVVTVGGSIEADGNVAGDAVAVGGGIRVGSGVAVGGDAVALGADLERDAGSTVGGDAVSQLWFYLPGQRQVFWRGALMYVLGWAGLVLLVSAILRRSRLQVMAAALRERVGEVLLSSAAILVGTVILFVIFGNAGAAGSILSSVLGGAIIVAALAGLAGLSFRFGSGLLPHRPPRMAAVVGAVLLAFLQSIPVAGWLVFLGAGLVALGSATSTGFGTAVDWLRSNLPPYPRPVSGTTAAGSNPP